MSAVFIFFTMLGLKELELESINGQIIDLVEKIDGLKNENKCLRDQNDELVIELEATKRYFSNITYHCILI